MRTFIAIELETNIKNNLSEFIRQMDQKTRSVRWVNSQGMHLTLKFLGETAEKKVAPVRSALDLAVKDYAPFPLSLKGTGCFPPKAKFPRVLWVGVEPNETLLGLQTRLENEMEKLGYPKEKREFLPHLTLGRCKKPQELGPVLSILQEQEKRAFGKMMVDKITFFQSVLKPTGAEYRVLSEHVLR
jgi:2'-5' RNA ligase